MALRINPAPTFDAPVEITIPGPMAKATERVCFTFRHKTLEGFGQWYEASKARPAGAAFLELVAGWTGLVDDYDAPLPFSEEAFTRLLANYPASGSEIVNAYLEALTESRAKNSKAPPAN